MESSSWWMWYLPWNMVVKPITVHQLHSQLASPDNSFLDRDGTSCLLPLLNAEIDLFWTKEVIRCHCLCDFIWCLEESVSLTLFTSSGSYDLSISFSTLIPKPWAEEYDKGITFRTEYPKVSHSQYIFHASVSLENIMDYKKLAWQCECYFPLWVYNNLSMQDILLLLSYNIIMVADFPLVLWTYSLRLLGI